MKKDILYSNDFMDIIMINPNYPFLEMKKSGAIILPYDSDFNIFLIKKTRPNIGTFYELPRGFLESGEDYLTGATRELLEETGLEPIETELIGSIQPDTGIMNNSVKSYAMRVKEIKTSFVHYDDIDKESCKVIKANITEINNLIANNKIICSYTLSTLYKFTVNAGVKINL